MTSQGSAYARFRRALDSGQTTKAFAAATDLPRVSLSDALDLCLLLAERRDQRFEAAARRWLARFAQERHASVPQIGMASAALAELAGAGDSQVARHTLEQLLKAPEQ